MKAIDFIQKMCAENLDLEGCNTCESEHVVNVGINQFFGFDCQLGLFEIGASYFYAYLPNDFNFCYMPSPDITLFKNSGDECVYLWKIED